MGSGIRITKGEIDNISGGRTVWEGLKSKIARWQADPNKPIQFNEAERQQIRQMMKLATDKLAAKQKIIQDARDEIVQNDDPTDHLKTSNKAKKALADVDMKGLNAGITPPGGAKQLDANKAMEYLKKAGGDKDKARKLAKDDGYQF